MLIDHRDGETDLGGCEWTWRGDGTNTSGKNSILKLQQTMKA